MTEELIDKLKKRLNNNIEVTPVYKNDEYEMLLVKFLKSQNYLKPEKILSIIKIIFKSDSPIGYILFKDKKKIVGFLGTIFSERKVNKNNISQCYLHSWIVDNDFRTQAFRLLIPILEKNFFISTYSPIPSLEGLYKKLNFEEKSFLTKLTFFFPFKSSSNKKVNISENKSFFLDSLSDDLKRVYKDHILSKNNIIFTYFDGNINDHILIIAKKKYKKIFLPVLEIIYVSNIKKFRNNRKSIIYELFKKFKTFFYVENFFNEESIFNGKNFFYKESKKKAYYKNIPHNFEFDFLYSELLD